jgi:hypothetical protein
MIAKYGLIPTNGRPCFQDSYMALLHQSTTSPWVVVGGPEVQEPVFLDEHVIREPELNISKWWNQGLALIESHARGVGHKRWDVAIVNDDAIVPDGWFHAVSATMRQLNVAAGCSGGQNTMPVLHTQPGPVNLWTRMQGFAFVLAGEKGVRANEQLKWYFSDDHVDWMARRAGGMVMIPGYHVEHRHPNAQLTGELQAQTALDAAAFQAYWGMRPW